MAYEWIKVEVITPDKPEVHRLAEILSIDPDSVLGKLIRIWAWADQQTIDGNANGNAASVTKNAIDRIAFLHGFADALLQVGWLKVEGSTLVFPNFDRHNGKSSKKRMLANRRVTEHREKGKKSNAESVTGAFQKALPEEEREEEVKDKTPLSGGGENLGNGVFEENSPPEQVPPCYLDGVDIPIGKFSLYDGWVPSADFQQRAALWGRVIAGPPPGYSPQELAAFTTYWGNEGKVFNHVQWEQKFADSVLYERRQQSQIKPTGGSNARTQQTTSSGESRAMQKFREAKSRRYGTDAGRIVGGDDRDLHGPLDNQERGGTITSLDSGDWPPDE
ncbi:DnaT-like ssDNA-binding domain-containing protein [Symbiopectobacterium sp.]|uniref:DnaT-like ssDNA-binding domain-containing protein n=1 Tax=Symbiopectobacterium sp. TaxID=2952789 RepID=UPI003F347FD7